MAPQYATLSDFRRGLVQLNQVHLDNLKQILHSGVRAEWKRRRINNLTLDQLTLIPSHWSFERLVFYPNGRTDYIAGQDYSSELKEVITALIGKKNN